MKAEIRTLNDLLNKVKKISNEAIYKTESMNKLAGACLKDGR